MSDEDDRAMALSSLARAVLGDVDADRADSALEAGLEGAGCAVCEDCAPCADRAVCEGICDERLCQECDSEAEALKRELREWLCAIPLESNRALVVATAARTWALSGFADAMAIVRYAQAAQRAEQHVESLDELFDACASGEVTVSWSKGAL